MALPPTSKRAIALEYDGASAPHVSAIGYDAVAEQIIALARAHDVPMLENHELAGLLSQLELGDEIPEPLYRCVAQIIAFAYRLRGRVPTGWTDAEDEPGRSPFDEKEAAAALPAPSNPAAANPDQPSDVEPDATPRR